VTELDESNQTAGCPVDFGSVDYFFDQSLVPDPYPYYDYLRAQCPVLPATPHGVVAITGHAEALAAYKDSAMSSCVAVAGPFPPLPFTPEGDDVTALIDAHRSEIPMAEHVVTMDGELHAKTRGLLAKLITPKRLSENEEFMWRLSDQQLDKFITKGSCEFMEDYAKPFAMLVIADLLGVPLEDHAEFRSVLGNEVVGEVGAGETITHNPLQWLDDKFRDYITDRRREPREDVLAELAAATYPDGSTPEVEDVVHLATFLFAAGMETTTKLLSTGMRVMAERPTVQQALRDNRALIPSFLEEALRTESPVKSHFRLAGTTTNIGGVDIPAGTILMMLPGASNRDPEKFEDPHEFKHDRRNVREHVAFGRGAHSCPGAPLARSEARISFNRFLDRMSDIRIDEAVHGSADERSYTYDPTFIMRGLSTLNVTFTPS
jgi:cytochrome P450